MALGTLRSDDGDGKDNVKKAIGFFVRASHLFEHLLPSLHDFDVKRPNSTFYKGRKQETTKFSFSFLTWIRLLGIQLQEGSRTFDKEARWKNRVEEGKTANSLFKRRFICRHRPRILRSLLLDRKVPSVSFET